MKNLTQKLFLSAMTITFMGCSGSKDKTNIELVTAMMDQESFKSQDWDPDRKGFSSMRVPPENTVPRGYKPYAYPLDPVAANYGLKNPIKGDFAPGILEVGRKRFQVYCAVCHGEKADGQGSVAANLFVKPPSLLTNKMKNYRDGRIYHAITDGYGAMGNYSRQILKKRDRWAVVNYIRTLQK